MDIREYRDSLQKKSDSLYEYIDKMKKQQKFQEKIVGRIEGSIEEAENQIAEINILLDEIEESLFGGRD